MDNTVTILLTAARLVHAYPHEPDSHRGSSVQVFVLEELNASECEGLAPETSTIVIIMHLVVCALNCTIKKSPLPNIICITSIIIYVYV